MKLKSSASQTPNPDKQDKCVNEIIICQKNAKNNFLLTKNAFYAFTLGYRFWPFHGLVGIFLILIFWFLNWNLAGIRTNWAFFPLWLGYCLLIDSIVFSRIKSSLLTRNPSAYLGLFIISIPVWWLFELINIHTQNWFYEGREHFSKVGFFLISSLCFSVVIPAVFGTAELVGTFPGIKKLHDSLRIPRSPGMAAILFTAALLMMLLIALWPSFFFPLVWVSVYLFIESLNLKLGYRTLLVQLARGDWRQVICLCLGSLICGFFWELWNYYSYPKWIYQIPYLDFIHVFEMPLLGYLGYLPFALELFALYHFVIGISHSDHLNDYVLSNFPGQ